MDENEYNFDFEGNESWALLALLAMIGSMSNPEPPTDIPPKITIDEFTIEQMRAASMNKKETEKLQLSSMYGECVNNEDEKEH